MASGLYRKRYNPYASFKMYGFDKISTEEEAELVKRLQRTTVSSVALPMNSTKKRLTTRVCPRNDELTEEAMQERLYLDEYRINRIFRRLQRSATQSSRHKRVTYDDHANRIAPPVPVAATTTGDPATNNLRLATTMTTIAFLAKLRPGGADQRNTEESDTSSSPHAVVTAFEERQTREKRITRLQRPTTASRFKQHGKCYFCEEDEHTAHYWDRPETSCQQCHAEFCESRARNRRPHSSSGRGSATVGDGGNIDRTVTMERLLRSTHAATGGFPLCDKAPPNTGISRIGLQCGTPVRRVSRKRLKEITRRLSRPKSAAT